MYAIFDACGKQYRVSVGDKIRIEKCPNNEGESLTFDHVLLIGNDDSVKVGTPVVAGASVVAKVLGHGKEDKVIVFKYKRKKNYRRFRGHRQQFTDVLIEGINA